MIKAIKTQIKLIMHKRGFLACFAIMMILVALNYIQNVTKYFEYNLADMPSFVNISTMSEDKGLSWLITQCYPFLVVIPAGFSLATDYAIKEDVFWISRCGKEKYIISKIIAVFLTTFICFTLPFILELILNVVTFPLNAHGNLFGVSLYSQEYMDTVGNFYLFNLYYKNPILYVLLMTLFLGVVSGMLSVVITAVSVFCHKYRAYLLLPIYLLLTGIGLIDNLLSDFPYKTLFSYYLRWCTDQVHKADFICFGLIITGVFLLSLCVFIVECRKDSL